MMAVNIVLLLVGLVLGGIIGFIVHLFLEHRRVGEARSRAELVLEEARQQAEAIKREAQDLHRQAEDLKREAEHIRQQAEAYRRELELQARDEALRLRREIEQELQARRRELQREEERLQRRWDDLERKLDQVQQREQLLRQQEQELEAQQAQIQKLHQQALHKLEEIAQLTQEEARQRLLAQVEQEARQEMARIVRQIEAEARAEGEQRARRILATVMQRIASESVAELTTSVIPLPSEDMKGRIIGRNGRNIRAFEHLTGVEVIVDDTPESVTLSSFDPVRREIARRALTKLVTDGRIHPTQIEKVVEQEKAEVERIIQEAGEEAVYEVGVVGLHPEVVKMLGRLKFRTSYGQNQLHHAVETAKLAALLAAELGADVTVAKTAGLLHDIGKAMDAEEGPHALVGARFLERYGVDPRVVHAVAAHHHDIEQETLEDIIVEIADALSGARPGARRESLEEYIKRIRALEDIARSFEGVADCYALQAGREIRVLVKPEAVDDYAMTKLAHEISKAIESNLKFPGQIQVTVIREKRATAVAHPTGQNANNGHRHRNNGGRKG